ncbi:MAG TPA: hypothetical protein PLO75_07235, partial [Thermotogota bacterium]|nr:hypothetical protein [Thermotogota bacterium]
MKSLLSIFSKRMNGDIGLTKKTSLWRKNSRTVRDEEEIVRRSLAISIYEGIGAVIYALVVQGVFFTKIALEFGADAFTLSLLLGIQYLSQVFQLIVPTMIARFGKRKPFVLTTVFLVRSLWLAILIL